MAVYHHTTRMIGRSKRGNPIKALAYISGIQLKGERTGETLDFKDKLVEEVQILLPEDAPEWAKKIQLLVKEDREKGLQLLSDIANAAEKRADGQVYREIEFSLPRELTYEKNKNLAEEYVQDQFCKLGMLAIQSFHVERCEKTGELNPHCHTFFLTRELIEEGLSEKKNREWNQKNLHETWREQWAQYASFHLKMHGYDITLDHRSYKDQGLDIEPQLKLGKGVKEQEKRARKKEDTRQESLKKDQALGEGMTKENSGVSSQAKSFVEKKTSTDRAKQLRDIQARNLYRILRKPEIIFDIVTRHHATFMWGDVQKTLHRYVDEPELFQRLDLRLRNSKELLLLHTEDSRNQEDRVEERAVYTTRSMLKVERSLIETAERISECKSHTVSSSSIEKGFSCITEKLKKRDSKACLSEGQEKAIRHVVEEGQLKCIVGYAGAGKTTALEVCREIWEAEGYSVYGLAPTGRAAQNLEGSGIRSQTLHKFLKSFEEGRSQYSDKSVLVLDEAGMVDVERFERFLGAVKSLGVKAVVVGDAAQLQPVEAGPAFRLITEMVGASRLEEVVRQKEDCQKEATILFGRQDSKAALQAYQSHGHIHLVKEILPEPKEKDGEEDCRDTVKRYEIAARTSGLIFREIMKEIKERHSEKINTAPFISQHQDYGEFLKWRETQSEAGQKILENAETFRHLLEERCLDPTEMARLFVSKKQDKGSQYKEAVEILKENGLHHLIGIERVPGQTVEVRNATKTALIEDWKKKFQENPDKSLLIMAYSNSDVRDLNTQARAHLRSIGVIEKKEFTYSITREVEDDFGRRKKFREERAFSKGDRIVFTQNNNRLGVKNGTIGIITELNNQEIQVKIEDSSTQEKTISFAPRLNPYFDQGWAVTIHKSQGTTVDKSFLLASHEMNQNLAYVAMTRHREDVQVYGSTLDFWREEKVSDILSKSGEKLSAVDYLDAQSLAKLMKEEDRFLERFFTRLSDELQAMGAVSKKAFKSVADHFLGRSSERRLDQPILLRPETIREEVRAKEIIQKIPKSNSENRLKIQDKNENQQKETIIKLQDVYEDMMHPAFKEADFYKRVFEEGLKTQGESASIEYWKSKREPYMRLFEQKIEKIEHELRSPILDYMSIESRDLARKVAFEDPDKILKFLSHLQEVKKVERESQVHTAQEREKALKLEQEKERAHKEAFKRAFSHYTRFKDLSCEIEKRYDSDLEKERRVLGKSIYKDKEMFERIEKIDLETSKKIKQTAQEKEHSYGRVGFSF